MCAPDESVIVGSAYLTLNISLRASGYWNVSTHAWVDNGHDNRGETAQYSRLEVESVQDACDGTIDALMQEVVLRRTAQVTQQLIGQEQLALD